jgi:hypothetical protein
MPLRMSCLGISWLLESFVVNVELDRRNGRTIVEISFEVSQCVLSVELPNLDENAPSSQHIRRYE